MTPLIRKAFALLPLILSIIACQGGRSPAAQELLSKACEALEQKDYNAVRLWADSIDARFITDSTTRWEALRLVRQAELAQSKQNLKHIDSLLPAVQTQCTELLQQFSRRQADEDRIATYSLAPFELGKTIGQNCLRMACDSLGKLYTESVYAGNKPIRHVAIRLSHPKGQARVANSIIPHDQALNYQFEVDGKYFEIMSYPEEDAQLMGEIILQLADEGVAMRLEYLSEAQHKKDDDSSLAQLFIVAKEVKTLARIIRLQRLLLQRQELRSQARYYDKRIKYLQQKLSE